LYTSIMIGLLSSCLGLVLIVNSIVAVDRPLNNRKNFLFEWEFFLREQGNAS